MTHVACKSKLQYRHLIAAPVDWMSDSAWLYKIKSKNKPSTPMTNIVCESKIPSVMRSSTIHAQETGWQSGVRSCIAFWAAHAFIAAIKCRHCTSRFEIIHDNPSQWTGWQSGVQLCIMPGFKFPTHLLQELYVGTADTRFRLIGFVHVPQFHFFDRLLSGQRLAWNNPNSRFKITLQSITIPNILIGMKHCTCMCIVEYI